jgi:hypothetical protein
MPGRLRIFGSAAAAENLACANGFLRGIWILNRSSFLKSKAMLMRPGKTWSSGVDGVFWCGKELGEIIEFSAVNGLHHTYRHNFGTHTHIPFLNGS